MRRSPESIRSRLERLRGPIVLIGLCAVPLLLWARSAPADGRFGSSYGTLTSLAVLCGLAGTSAFALNLVLGARLRPVESLFGGLDRMYLVHRLNGQVAFALLFGHVVLILASRATISTGTALDLLGPGAGATVFVGVLAFATLTVSIALTLLVRLGQEVFVYVQRTFGVIFLAATYHVFTTNGATEDSAALELYLAALATLGLAAFAYRSLFSSLLVRRRRYRVVEANRLDEFVTEVVMEPVGKPLRYEAGQFAFVNFRSPALESELKPFELSMERQVLAVRPGEIANQFHPFSINSAPGDERLRITVKAVGDYTRALRLLEHDAEAIVEGPYGSFTQRGIENRRQIWIAGGIGVTPFLSMARALGGEGRSAVDFYYCVEHEEEAHFLDELRALERDRPDFRVVIVPRDRDGFLAAARLVEAHADLTSADVLICGPPAMLTSLRTQLEAVGVPASRIHTEEFAFARRGPSSEQRATADEERTPRLSEDVVFALLAAFVFAGISSAGIVVGSEVFG